MKKNFSTKFMLGSKNELIDFQKLFNKGPITLVQWINKNGWPIIYATENIFELTGYTNNEFITGKISYDKIIYKEDLTRIKKDANYFVQNSTDNYEQSYRIITKNGEIKWILDYSQVIKDNENNIIVINGYLIDQSRNIKLESSFLFQKLKFDNVIQGTKIGTWEWNIQNNEVIVNDFFIEMLGYNKSELSIKSSDDWEKICHPDDLIKLNLETQKHINKETEFYECEVRLKKKDNSWIWVLDKGKIIKYDDSGNPEIMFGFHININDIKIREQTLTLYNKLLLIEKNISEIIINENNIDITINKILELITHESKQDRAYIFEFHKFNYNDVFSQRYEYAVENVTSQINNPDLQNIPLNEIAPRWYNLLSNNQILMGNIHEFATSEKELLEEQSIISLLEVPIFIEKKFWGFIGFDNCHEKFNWTSFEIDLLKFAGNAIANLIIRKNYENIIKENEEKLKLIIDTSPDIICLKDSNGKWLLANNADLELFQLEKVDYRNKTDSELAEFTHPIYKNAFLKCMESDELAWSKKSISHGIEIIPIPNGNNKIYDVIKVPTFNLDGTRKGLIVLGRDITELKKKEEELENYKLHLENLVRKRTEELEQANEEIIKQLQKEKELEFQLKEALIKEKELAELRNNFIASVSHEFRTPLSALLSSTQLIQKYGKTWNSEKLNEHYTRIDNIINQLTKLLDDILTISKAEKEILQNEPELTNLEETINDFIFELKSKMLDTQKLILNFKLRDKFIYIDKKLLGYIFKNILSNSIKYTGDNGIIEISVEQSEFHKLKITISDNGIGIEETEIKNIFEPFYRCKNSYYQKGSGLGLNIVKRCLDLLNGQITVQSKINEGTTFSVEIPYQIY